MKLVRRSGNSNRKQDMKQKGDLQICETRSQDFLKKPCFEFENVPILNEHP